MDFPRLRDLLRKHEGYRDKVYTCSAGKLTIGVGHNLTDLGLDSDVIDLQFAHDIQTCIEDCTQIFSNWDDLPDVVQVVLANMSFNLGASRLRAFKRMIGAVELQDFDLASVEMLDSLWATQVGRRATELSELMNSQK